MIHTKTITNSSQVIEIGYDTEHQIFSVTYKNGKKYHYLDCPVNLWDMAEKVVAAGESVGKFVNEHIKNINIK